MSILTTLIVCTAIELDLSYFDKYCLIIIYKKQWSPETNFDYNFEALTFQSVNLKQKEQMALKLKISWTKLYILKEDYSKLSFTWKRQITIKVCLNGQK